MLKVIGIVVLVLIVIFIGYVSTRESKFHYERSGVIAAAPEKIFPFLVDFKTGHLWSPYEQVDPNMKKTFSGPEKQVGSVMEFEGNRDVGSGKLEILKIEENKLVEIRLTMLKPFHAENIVEYKLTPESDGTRFTWSMHGDGGFMGKLMTVLIDCEAMIGGQFSQGIQNLKQLIENSSTAGETVNLNEIPEIVTWPTTYYVFVEKSGPFQETAKPAWDAVHAALPEVLKNSKLKGMMSLYKVKPQMIYRAGFILEAKPNQLPEGFQYVEFEGGKYSKFTLKGSYSQLGSASGRVFGIIEEKKMLLREDFFIEHYVNDPKVTPEDQLITEILVPTK